LPHGGVLALCESPWPRRAGRELSLPKEWTSAEARCAGAGIPAERTVATKPQ